MVEGWRHSSESPLVVIPDQPVEEPYAEARAPGSVDLGLRGIERSAGNVEVGPGRFLDESLDELGAGNGAAMTAAGILHVGEPGIDQLVIVGAERHSPDALARRLAG